MVAGSTSETEIIESHRFSFWCMGRWLAALRRPGAHQRYADTWPTANARTQWPLLARLRHAAMSAQWSLSGGGKRTSRGSPISVAIDRRAKPTPRLVIPLLGASGHADHSGSPALRSIDVISAAHSGLRAFI